MRSSGEYFGGTGQDVVEPQRGHVLRRVYLPQLPHLRISDLISLALALEDGGSAVCNEVFDSAVRDPLHRFLGFLVFAG